MPSPKPNSVNDVEYWQERAEEARVMAEGFNDPKTKEIMLGIARSYDLIAASAASASSKREKLK